MLASAARLAVPISRAVIAPGRAGAGCAATARLQRAPVYRAYRSLAVQAAGSGGKKWRPAGEARQPKEERTLVTFRAPGQESPRRFERINQAELEAFLQGRGADGFRTASGNVSRRLQDLPDGGDVDLVLPDKMPFAQQVSNLQSSFDNTSRGKEQQLVAWLQTIARKEHAGSHISVLPSEPYKGLLQQDFLQLDAAVKVGDTLYVGEHKLVLSEVGVDDIEGKLLKIRAALKRNSSPDLAAALHGVTHVKLYLAGEAVRAGLAVGELANLAATVGASVVLPSGLALSLAGKAAPAVQL